MKSLPITILKVAALIPCFMVLTLIGQMEMPLPDGIQPQLYTAGISYAEKERHKALMEELYSDYNQNTNASCVQHSDCKNVFPNGSTEYGKECRTDGNIWKLDVDMVCKTYYDEYRDDALNGECWYLEKEVLEVKCPEGCYDGLGICKGSKTPTPTPDCKTDANCPVGKYTGTAFCKADGLYQKYISNTCDTTLKGGICVEKTTDKLIVDCETAGKVCAPKYNKCVTCNTDADCPASKFATKPYCIGNIAHQPQATTYTCSNPGTPVSMCNSNILPAKKTDCSAKGLKCEDGQCISENQLEDKASTQGIFQNIQKTIENIWGGITSFFKKQ